jgi:hypothetical protein
MENKVLTRGKSMIKIVETPAGRQYGSASEKEAEESEEKLVDKKEKKRRSGIVGKRVTIGKKELKQVELGAEKIEEDKHEKKRIRSSILNKITIVNTKIMGKLDMKLSRVRAI